jgi:hypothetical protein
MANAFKNPIILDTFTSAIDVGNSIFGDSYARFKIQSIEWQEPTTAGHTAVVTDGGGNPIFDETCVVANQSVIKYFTGAWVSGIKTGTSGVGSGKIVILLE